MFVSLIGGQWDQMEFAIPKKGSKIGQICQRIIVENWQRRGAGVKNSQNLPTSYIDVLSRSESNSLREHYICNGDNFTKIQRLFFEIDKKGEFSKNKDTQWSLGG